MRTLLCLTVIAFLGLPGGTSAAVFGFGKKKSNSQHANAADRIFELIHALRNSPMASRRAEAAEVLGTMDVERHPEIVPNLIEVLKIDTSNKVRTAAIRALSEIRPRQREIAEALEHTSQHDSSLLVRIRARSAKFGYRYAEPVRRKRPEQSQPLPLPPSQHQSAKKRKKRTPTPAALPASASPMLKAPPMIYSREPKPISPAVLPSTPLLLDNSSESRTPQGIFSAPR